MFCFLVVVAKARIVPQFVLAYPAGAFACNVASGDIVIVTQVRQRAGEGVNVACALDVHPQRQVASHRKVIDCRQMKDNG